MTCRHGPYDPNCSSYQSNLDRLKRDYANQIVGQTTPDSEQFHVEDSAEIGGPGSKYLVLKVSYPNCKSCSYEGSKVMVFEGMMLADAIKWKKIDPHFREPGDYDVRSAPGPIARFPASDEGWADAVDYARLKSSRK